MGFYITGFSYYIVTFLYRIGNYTTSHVLCACRGLSLSTSSSCIMISGLTKQLLLDRLRVLNTAQLAVGLIISQFVD
jgi:hypothetical protein